MARSVLRFAAAILACSLSTGSALAEPLFDAFESACFPDLSPLEGAVGRMEADGWERVAIEADPALLQAAGNLLEPTERVRTLGVDTFRRVFDGQPIFVVLQQKSSGDVVEIIACHAFDFSAPGPVDGAAFEAAYGTGVPMFSERWNMVASYLNVRRTFYPDDSAFALQRREGRNLRAAVLSASAFAR